MKTNKTIRHLIRNIINEYVAPPGTSFGPYEDETVLLKNKMKNSQFFKLAIRNADMVCDEPKSSNDAIDCPYNYEFIKTRHSAERQFRHVGNTIEDEEVGQTIKKATDSIVKYILSGALKFGDAIVIKNISTNLNIVLEVKLERESGGESIIQFPLITVMRKPNFMPRPGQKIIYVK